MSIRQRSLTWKRSRPGLTTTPDHNGVGQQPISARLGGEAETQADDGGRQKRRMLQTSVTPWMTARSGLSFAPRGLSLYDCIPQLSSGDRLAVEYERRSRVDPWGGHPGLPLGEPRLRGSQGVRVEPFPPTRLVTPRQATASRLQGQRHRHWPHLL